MLTFRNNDCATSGISPDQYLTSFEERAIVNVPKLEGKLLGSVFF